MIGDTIAFVLWGEGCDESLAVAWVSRLRAEGRRVYLVGVSGRRVRGQYGIGLEVDIRLDEALALVEQAELVIVPCKESAVLSFHRDPRFHEFLERAAESGAQVVVCPEK
ncbi:MAG: hypothetical protein KJZ86_05375 [Caldilineaceae bacterium]|nr:hypothetical protein [Caldilineaceae bacterium]HRJ44110.1 hypothetical protein [Caldilineaceae bacterium]